MNADTKNWRPLEVIAGPRPYTHKEFPCVATVTDTFKNGLRSGVVWQASLEREGLPALQSPNHPASDDAAALSTAEHWIRAKRC